MDNQAGYYQGLYGRSIHDCIGLVVDLVYRLCVDTKIEALDRDKLEILFSDVISILNDYED